MALQRRPLLVLLAVVALLARISNRAIIVNSLQEGIDHDTTTPRQEQSGMWTAPTMRATHPESAYASAQV